MLFSRSRNFSSLVITFAIFALTLIVVCLGAGCNGRRSHTPDVSKITVNLNTSRFDLDLYALDTNHIAEGLKKLHDKYPDFLDYYLDTIRAYNIHGHYADSTHGIRNDLRIDLTFRDFVDLEDSIRQHFPATWDPGQSLTEGFKLTKYYINNFEVPRILFLNMGLSKWPSFPIDKHTIGVGLDMFLGDQYPHYKDVGIPSYMYTHFRPGYLPVSVFNTVYQVMHPFQSDDRTLLDLMLQRGREQYFLHQVLPSTPDSVLFGFTAVQLRWCGENEGLVYNFFIHQNLLYSKESHYISPYVYDGPFAKDLESPTDVVKVSPGNIGTWMGYRIVTAYMSLHPNLSLADLLNDQTDPAKFLQDARYRPK